MLNQKQVQQIVNKTSRICGHELVFINTKEKIIAAYNKERIGSYHNGISRVINKREVLISSEEEASQKGVHGGIVLPVVVNDEVIGAIGITGEPEEVRKYGELVKNQVEMMYKQEILFEASKSNAEIKNTFIQELLSLNIYNDQNPELIHSLGNFLGYEIGTPRIVVIVSVDTADNTGKVGKGLNLVQQNSILSNIQNVLDSTEDIVTKIGSNQILILKNIKNSSIESREFTDLIKKIEKDFLRKYYTTYLITIGNYYPGLLGLKKSFNDAEKTLVLAHRMGYTQGVFYLDDFKLGRILYDVNQETKESLLSDPGYQKIKMPEAEWLLDTILVFFENNLNLSKSARKLHIHRNTLVYRLDKIEELMGYDLRNFKQAISLYLILKLGDFH